MLGHMVASKPSAAPHLDVVTSFFHFGAHFGDDFLRQVFGPNLRIFHALIEDGGLLHDQLAAERRFVEGEYVLEFLLREPRGIELGDVVHDLRAAGGVFRVEFGRDFIQILAEHRIGLQKDALGPLDDARNQGAVERGRGASGARSSCMMVTESW